MTMCTLRFITLTCLVFLQGSLAYRPDDTESTHIAVISRGSFHADGKVSRSPQNISHGRSLLSTGASAGRRSIEKHKKCAPLPFWSQHYLKRKYRVSMALSAAMLDKILRQEAPGILEGMGFEYVTVGSDATFKFLQVSPTEIKMSITSVSLQYNGVSLGTDITLFLTIEIQENTLHFKDVGVDTAAEEPPRPQEDSGGATPTMMGRLWHGFRRYTAPAQDTILNFAINKGIGVMELNTFQRNLCMSNTGGRFDLRISKFVVDDNGDLGIGLTFHDAGCPGEWKDDEMPMLDTTEEQSLLKYVGENLEENYADGTDLPPSERSRIAVYFEDGFVEKLSGDQGLGAGVDGALKAHSFNPLKDVVASSEVGRQLFADVINMVLKFGGVAEEPHLQDVRGHCYRFASGWFSDASFIVVDLTNKGQSIVDSLFNAMEKRALFGGAKGEQLAAQGEVPDSTVTLGECS